MRKHPDYERNLPRTRTYFHTPNFGRDCAGFPNSPMLTSFRRVAFRPACNPIGRLQQCTEALPHPPPRLPPPNDSSHRGGGVFHKMWRSTCLAQKCASALLTLPTRRGWRGWVGGGGGGQTSVHPWSHPIGLHLGWIAWRRERVNMGDLQSRTRSRCNESFATLRNIHNNSTMRCMIFEHS